MCAKLNIFHLEPLIFRSTLGERMLLLLLMMVVVVLLLLLLCCSRCCCCCARPQAHTFGHVPR